MADKQPKIDEQVSYNTTFLVLSLAFGAVSIWAVYDELYTRRPYRNYQVEFFKVDEQLKRQEYERQQKDVNEREDYKAKKAELAKLEGELAGPKRSAYEQAKAKLQKLQFDAFDAEQEYTFAKSEWEELYYYYTVAKHAAGDQEGTPENASAALKSATDDVNAAREEMERRDQFFNEVDASRKEAAEAVVKFAGPVETLRKEVDKIEIELANSRRKWEVAKEKADAGSLATEILQYNLEPLGTVDRCETCHMGIAKGGYEKVQPAVFQSHPLRRTLLRYHPPDKFGCTSCHDGQGRATYVKQSAIYGEVDYPHAPGGHSYHSHYWERPLLTGPQAGPDYEKADGWYMESKCRVCHADEMDLRSFVYCATDIECPEGLACSLPPGVSEEEATDLTERMCADPDSGLPKLWNLAPNLSRGKRIIEEVGCYGCHLIPGYEHKPKHGPDLRRVAAKIDPGWLVEWIKHPKAIRPNTRMPNFFPEALDVKDYPPSALRDDVGKAVDWKRKRDTESIAIASFLLSASQEFELREAPAGDAARGKALFDEVGCHGCHEIGDTPVDQKNRASRFDNAPDLSDIAAKTSANWIFTWLKNPRQYNAHSRMPNLRLSDDEAAHVTAYLTTLEGERTYSRPAGLNPNNKELVEEGKERVKHYGCFGCHLISGFEELPGIGAELSEFGAKGTDRLDYGDFITDHNLATWDRWTYHKLKHPRVYRYERVNTRMPQFDFTDEEAWSLMTVLRGLKGKEQAAVYAVELDKAGQLRERGRELVRRYNCYGCHTLDGYAGDIRARYPDDQESFAPPILWGEGEKTQPEWLFGFFKDVVSLRPWLTVRMPTFGFSDEEATSLVGMFSALDDADYPYRYYEDIQLTGVKRDVAKRVFDQFKCLSCHLAGDKKLTPDQAAQAAPNLLLAKDRLRAEWIPKWLSDPNVLMPGTRMPGFFPAGIDMLEAMLSTPDGQKAYSGVLEEAKKHGKRDATMALLRDYLMTMDTTPAAKTASAQ